MISPAFPTASWQKRVLPLEGPARLLLYSDGIIEAQGEDGEFGLTRLLDLIRACPEGPPAGGGQKGAEHLPDRILSTLRSFVGGRPMSDDITLLEARLAD